MGLHWGAPAGPIAIHLTKPVSSFSIHVPQSLLSRSRHQERRDPSSYCANQLVANMAHLRCMRCLKTRKATDKAEWGELLCYASPSSSASHHAKVPIYDVHTEILLSTIILTLCFRLSPTPMCMKVVSAALWDSDG